MKRLWAIVLIAAALSSCRAPPVPDEAYFRMPAVDIDATSSAEPDSDLLPIVVDPLRAHGVYNDQAILYALEPEGSIKS